MERILLFLVFAWRHRASFSRGKHLFFYFILLTVLFKSININHVFLVINLARSVGSPYCTAEEDYCQANAECHDNYDFFTCQCKAGFKLDGELCVGNDKMPLYFSLSTAIY